MPDERPTLDYQSPQRRRPRKRDEGLAEPAGAVAKFFLGFVISLILSAIIWIFAGGMIFRQQETPLNLLILVGFFKLAFATVLMLYYPRYRATGFGILLSLPVAGMIFVFGACANMRWSS